MYLDTANIESINKLLPLGIFSGVTTNPKILAKENKTRDELLRELIDLDISKLFIQLQGKNMNELFDDYIRISEIFTNKKIIIKIIANRTGFEIARKIKKYQINQEILGTVVVSSEQGLLCGQAGFDYIAPYVNRMLVNNIDPYKVIQECSVFFKQHNLDCQIVSASFRNSEQVVKALVNGSTTVTISPAIALEMMDKDICSIIEQEFCQISGK